MDPETRTVIIASGASARWLGLESEHKLIGHGVSSCAALAMDSSTGVKTSWWWAAAIPPWRNANFLTRFGREVTLVHRREEFRALQECMLDRAHHNPKIKFVMNTVVEEVFDVSQKLVTAVRLRNLKTNEVSRLRMWMASFVAIGHIPNTKVFKGQIETDQDGYILSKGGARTNIAGVFHAETCRTGSTARPSPRPARDAWRPWKPSVIWKRKDTNDDRVHFPNRRAEARRALYSGGTRGLHLCGWPGRAGKRRESGRRARC